MYLSASSSWFISDTREGHHHSFTSFQDLWQEIKNIKRLYEIMRSVNPTKFNNKWPQNIQLKTNISGVYWTDDQCKNLAENNTSRIDEIHKELEELYLSQFNTGKNQHEGGIQKLSKIFTWAKSQYIEQLQQDCYDGGIGLNDFYIIWNQTLKGVRSGMKTISINVIIDTDVTINNMSFNSRDIVYKINFLYQGNKILCLSVMNVTFERIYLSVESSHMSMFVKDSIFIRSGIQINPQFNVNSQAVTIDNCTFLGHISYPAVEVINTTNVSVTNSRFQNLECVAPHVSVVICHDSQLELRNVFVDGCVCFNTILIHQSNMTASYVRVKNNRNRNSDYYTGKLLSTDKSILHIDSSTFEENLNDALMDLDSSYVNINLCTFRNNYVWCAIRTGYKCSGSYCPGLTTITNTMFANNTIRGYFGWIIGSYEEKVYLTNVTLVHNHGISVSCHWSVIEMMSCQFTNNREKGILVLYQNCKVTMTNLVFQGNYGSLFYLLNSNLTVTKSHFSDNFNPDAGGVFFVHHDRDESPSVYIDIVI